MRVLATDVYVAGRCWFAGSVPPPEVASRITNDDAWCEVPGDGAEPAPRPDGPTVVEPVPEQPNSGPGDDTAIGEVVDDTTTEPAGPGTTPEPAGPDPEPVLPDPEPVLPDPEPVVPVDEPVDPGQPEPDVVTEVVTEQTVEAPPRSGKGSSLDAWREFARIAGVDVPADADRTQVIAACEAAGLLGE